MLSAGPGSRLDRGAHSHRAAHKRPALMYLGLMVLADRGIAERLLRGDPIDSAITHPHYHVLLDDADRATLSDIRERAVTVDELLNNLAEVADGVSADVL